MTTAEIANKLVSLCQQGKNLEAINTFYATDILSVEAHAMPDMPRETRGLANILKKNEWWLENHVIHSSSVSGPYVAVDKFVAIFSIDVTFKPSGQRNQMSEVAVYTVANDKIVHEEFLYQMP